MYITIECSKNLMNLSLSFTGKFTSKLLKISDKGGIDIFTNRLIQFEITSKLLEISDKGGIDIFTNRLIQFEIGYSYTKFYWCN